MHQALNAGRELQFLPRPQPPQLQVVLRRHPAAHAHTAAGDGDGDGGGAASASASTSTSASTSAMISFASGTADDHAQLAAAILAQCSPVAVPAGLEPAGSAAGGGGRRRGRGAGVFGGAGCELPQGCRVSELEFVLRPAVGERVG